MKHHLHYIKINNGHKTKGKLETTSGSNFHNFIFYFFFCLLFFFLFQELFFALYVTPGRCNEHQYQATS